jgi:hypothetical protein
MTRLLALLLLVAAAPMAQAHLRRRCCSGRTMADDSQFS